MTPLLIKKDNHTYFCEDQMKELFKTTLLLLVF